MALTIRAWIDHPRIGCGFREFVVAKIGPKWVHLITAATGEHIEITRSEYDSLKPTELRYRPGRLASRLRRNAEAFGQDTLLLKGALADLRQVQL